MVVNGELESDSISEWKGDENKGLGTTKPQIIKFFGWHYTTLEFVIGEVWVGTRL